MCTRSRSFVVNDLRTVPKKKRGYPTSLLDEDALGGADAAFVVVLAALEGEREASCLVVNGHIEVPRSGVPVFGRELHDEGFALSGKEWHRGALEPE